MSWARHAIGARSPLFMLRDMTIQRMDNVAIVVEDLDAAVAFFAELGSIGTAWPAAGATVMFRDA